MSPPYFQALESSMDDRCIVDLTEMRDVLHREIFPKYRYQPNTPIHTTALEHEVNCWYLRRLEAQGRSFPVFFPGATLGGLTTLRIRNPLEPSEATLIPPLLPSKPYCGLRPPSMSDHDRLYLGTTTEGGELYHLWADLFMDLPLSIRQVHVTLADEAAEDSPPRGYPRFRIEAFDPAGPARRAARGEALNRICYLLATFTSHRG